jgi:molybdopterin/thiamine biosynthesis adenylyltransferase
VRVPEAALGIDSPIYPAGANLLEQALWALRAATDVKDLVREVAASSQAFDVALAIGKPAATAGMRIHFGCDGWLALVAEQPVAVPASAETNPFGALLAAAIAVGRLHAFQVNAVGGNIPRPTETWALNALTLTAVPGGATLPSNVSLPSTLLVGGGALSSAIAYAMTHIRGSAGDVDAVDKDVLKRTNSNRQITARFEQAKPENLHKVDELASAWPAIRPARVMYNEFKQQREGGAGNYELAVTAVDNTEARREVALDLPRALIDGATGGLMVTLMRGCDPTESCVACAYPEIKAHEDEIWVKRLGHNREQVQKLRDGTKRFDEVVVEQIRAGGTLIVNEEVERGLLTEGWAYLKRAACGSAKLDRDLPAASVSYVSAICGFLMAAQMVGEAIGAPTLVSKPRWAWGDVLRQAPCEAEFENRPVVKSCAERHDLRREIYSRRWPKN